MNENTAEVKRMRKILSILLAAISVILACTASVYADDDDNNEAADDDAGQANSGDDEPENSVPGFELPIAGGAAIAVAWLIRSRLA